MPDKTLPAWMPAVFGQVSATSAQPQRQSKATGGYRPDGHRGGDNVLFRGPVQPEGPRRSPRRTRSR